jgi:hypothetical protein
VTLTADSSVVCDTGGVEAIVASDLVRITLSDLTSTNQLLSVVWDLQHILRDVAPEKDWVVDISDIEDPPLPLLSVLMALDRELHERGRRLKVTGLHSGHVGGRSFTKLINLREKPGDDTRGEGQPPDAANRRAGRAPETGDAVIHGDSR